MYEDLSGTCINCDVADDSCMVRESDILGVLTTAIGTGAIGRCGLLVNNECALNIDLHRAGMDDSAVYFGGVCEGPGSLSGFLVRGGIAASLRHNRRHGEKQV